MSATFAERVATGIKVLNDHDPEWHRDVDLKTLNMESVLYCILGQVFGGYNAGVCALFIEDYTNPAGRRLQWEYGFDLKVSEYNGETITPTTVSGLFEELTQEWIKQIRAMSK